VRGNVRSDDEINFWRAVNAQPDDRLYRDILADWLDDHGRGYEAEALRKGDPFTKRFPRNLALAASFLFPADLDLRVLHNDVAIWQRFVAAWDLCRRAGVNPRGEYDERRQSRWRIVADMTIRFALAQMPEDQRWDEKEQRKAVSAAFPFGEWQFHPYKIWLSEVKRRLGPTCRGRTVRTQERGLFEDAMT
jgi:uncharacterized protein (TIGR02996 family)